MEFSSIEDLMTEIDTQVKRLIDVFRFIFKYRVLFMGSGIEFSDLREYVPGQDDADRIDWKASLRSQKLYVKQFEEERDLDLFILLDASSSMIFGTGEKLKSEYAAVVAGAIAYAGLDVGDNVGFAMFNDEVTNMIPPSGDTSTYFQILSLVVDPQNYGGQANLAKALDELLGTVSSKTTLFVISDFIGLDEGWGDSIRMISAKLSHVVCMMVRDERDSVIEPGVGYARLSDPFSGNVRIVDLNKLRQSFGEEASKQEKRIENEMHDSRCGFVKTNTSESFVEPLLKYLEMEEAW